MHAIELRGVGKRFNNVQAVKDISAVLPFGQLTGLVGPDGAGKTTLMRLIATLLQPSEGTVRVAGHDVTKEARLINRVTGYMPQRFGLYEDLSVMENLQLYADLGGLESAQRQARFALMLDFTRLAPFVARLAGRLSGGMKQKLGLACALLANPRVLLLDEPSVGVDPVSRRELWSMVQELAAEGIAIVWSTAYLDEAERCEHVLLLNAGKIAYAGPPKSLTDRLSGRSFCIVDVGDGRRRLLTKALELSHVRDGVIQGAAIRVVLAKGASVQPLASLAVQHQARIEPVAARFEDAFIDLLGGGPGGHSAIAEKMRPVEHTRDVMVECRNLTKRFGDFTATDNISFAVQRGEVFGLLGPNGAGKSTTFRMLCGLARPTSGSAEVAGLDLREASAGAKLQLGYMAQKFSLYGLLSVRQNLEFFSGAYGLRGKLQQTRIEEMIDTFGLQPFLKASPDSLPLGYKQRLALACALMHRPKVLFLDEPTSGVDPLTRREFWTHITGLVGKGVTVMVTTHFMDEAEYCDRVALIHRAKLIALDTPDGLKRQARDAEHPDPSMEDAFVELVRRRESLQEKAA